MAKTAPSKPLKPFVPKKITGAGRKPGGPVSPLGCAFRSGLERANEEHLILHRVPVLYEQHAIAYQRPATLHTYTPDFLLPNGIFVETKGLFELEDRKKHLLVKAQWPHLDIRFVFTNPNARLYKASRTTYADWCDKHGFQWAKRLIPPAWWLEPGPERKPANMNLTMQEDAPPPSDATQEGPPPVVKKTKRRKVQTDAA